MIDRNQISTNQPALNIGECQLKTLETDIDGCHVTLRFPDTTDESIFFNVREILKNAYIKSVS